MTSEVAIRTFTRELLLPEYALGQLEQAKVERPEVQRLYKHAENLGFKPMTGPKDVMGFTETYRALQPVKDPEGEQTIEEGVVDFYVQDLSSSTTEDIVAIATVRVRAGDKSLKYEMLLEAPKGNFLKAREFMVKENEVVLANSWWSRFVACLRNRCITTCLAALIGCSGSWVAYIGCVLVACGGCGLRCAGCASCRCRWWCRWAVGCCE